MAKIKWAICDDADYFCYIYKTKLENFDNLEFCGYCLKSSDAAALVKETQPNVLFLDIQMETTTAGIDILPKLKELAPDMKVIMLTSYNDEDYIYDAFASGADNYLLKDNDSVDHIVSVIKDTYENKGQLPPEIAKILVKKTRNVERSMKSLLYVFEIMSKLSTSEYEILKDLYNGNSYKEIAEKRFVTESTVRNHITRILKKFHSPSMRELLSNLHDLSIFDYLS